MSSSISLVQLNHQSKHSRVRKLFSIVQPFSMQTSIETPLLYANSKVIPQFLSNKNGYIAVEILPQAFVPENCQLNLQFWQN